MSNLEENSRYKREKLKRLREEKYITIPDMAQLLGMSKDGYFKIESGAIYPRLPLAFKIAKLLQTTVDELFGI